MNTNFFLEKVLIPYIIPILLISFLSVILLLFLNRFKIIVSNIQYKRLERKINALLPEVLLSESSESNTNLKIEKLRDEFRLDNFWLKERLVQSFMDFESNLKGLDKSKFHKIYEALNLNKYSYGFLKSPFIYYKKKGIHQFEMMDYKPAAKKIEPYLNHSNEKLRSNALIAYVLLTERDLSFLINIKHEPLFIKEIEILEICKMRKLKRPDLLKEFLSSENDFIVRLGLRLAVYYNASDLENFIANCIYHENPMVRELTYIAIDDLFLIEKSYAMVSRYDEETASNKTQIIKSLYKIGNESHLNFLKSHLLMSQQNQLEIARAINFIDPKSLSDLALKDQRIQKLKKHIDENLLK